MKIDYPEDGSTLTEATYSLGEGPEKRQEARRYVRVRIQNVGKRIAQNCRVFLTDIKEVQAAGALMKTPFHDSMILSWPVHDFGPRSIPAGVNMYVDAVSFIEDSPGWRFGIEKVYSSLQSMRAYKGTYRLTLLATADECHDHIEFAIDVTYDQRWDSIRATAV